MKTNRRYTEKERLREKRNVLRLKKQQKERTRERRRSEQEPKPKNKRAEDGRGRETKGAKNVDERQARS